MGGFGSGRREYATTPTVEECRAMDTDKLKDLTEHPNAAGQIYWGDPDNDDTSYLAWRTEGVRELDGEERADRVRFRYTTTHYPSEESTTVEYVVRFNYTEPNFGGVRPWFMCPECGTRRRKLYLPPRRNADRFLCRECYDLGYRSSRTSGDELERAEQRYRKAFAKADAEDRRPHPNNPPYTPDRPKGTHRDTFDDLLADVRKARQEWDDRMNGRMRELLDQYDTGAEHAAGAFGYTDR